MQVKRLLWCLKGTEGFRAEVGGALTAGRALSLGAGAGAGVGGNEGALGTLEKH